MSKALLNLGILKQLNHLCSHQTREIKLPSACRLHHTFLFSRSSFLQRSVILYAASSLKFSASPQCKTGAFLLLLIRMTSPRAKAKEIPANSRTAWARLPPSSTVCQSHPRAQIRLNSLTFWQDVKATSFMLPESRRRTVQCTHTHADGRAYACVPDRTLESNYMLAKYLQSIVNSYGKALWEIKLGTTLMGDNGIVYGLP